MVETVQYSRPLVSKLEKSLRAAFNPSTILNRKPENIGTRFDVSLRNGQPARTGDRPEQMLLPIVVPGRENTAFWFGFVANFEISIAEVRKFDLVHASLTVFHDIGSREPLFRAEWDHKDAVGSSKHAQPHWHFVQSPESIEVLVRTLLAPASEAATEFVPDKESAFFSGIADCGRFHFAMTSLWEKSGTPPYRKKLFDSNDFPNWFDNLAIYIADQVSYILSHLPASATADIREFS